MFKIFHGFNVVDMHVFVLALQTSITRNSNGKLFIRQCSTTKLKCYFSQRVAENWNSFKKFIDNSPKLVNCKNCIIVLQEGDKRLFILVNK